MHVELKCSLLCMPWFSRLLTQFETNDVQHSSTINHFHMCNEKTCIKSNDILKTGAAWVLIHM